MEYNNPLHAEEPAAAAAVAAKCSDANGKKKKRKVHYMKIKLLCLKTRGNAVYTTMLSASWKYIASCQNS
jgi:hypothetical protein